LKGTGKAIKINYTQSLTKRRRTNTDVNNHSALHIMSILWTHLKTYACIVN